MEHLSEAVKQWMGMVMSKAPAHIPPVDDYERACAERTALVNGAQDCPKCGGVGFVKYNVKPEHPLFGKFLVCDCHPDVLRKQAAEVAARWADSGVPEHQRHWTLSYTPLAADPDKAAAVQAAQEILTRRAGWLLLHGDPGVGKTGIGTSLVCAFVQAGLSARIVMTADVLLELRDCFRDDAPLSEKQVHDKYAAYDLLVIDECDPDRLHGTPWALQSLFRLFNARYVSIQERATVFTSNRKPAEYGKEWAYLLSRLRAGLMIEMPGQDLRAL